MTKISNLRIRILKFIQTAVQSGKKKEYIMNKIRDMIIKSVPDYNVREKYGVYKAAETVVDAAVLQGKNYIGPNNREIYRFCTDINKIDEHCNRRDRLKKLKNDMNGARATGGVFYLLSEHSNPAKDHKDYQGKIYVDRYWRNILKDDPNMLRATTAYIRNHSLMTVQKVCSEPVWMIRRPYCKHYFIPLDTSAVLGSSLNKIKKTTVGSYVITKKGNYRKKYYKLRLEIHRQLGMHGMARRDIKLINKKRT